MRKTVHLRACAMFVPAASKTFFVFSRAMRVCPWIVVSGFSRRVPNWPAAYTRFPTLIPGVRVGEAEVPAGMMASRFGFCASTGVAVRVSRAAKRSVRDIGDPRDRETVGRRALSDRCR